MPAGRLLAVNASSLYLIACQAERGTHSGANRARAYKPDQKLALGNPMNLVYRQYAEFPKGEQRPVYSI
jgi:hypothetical protein